MIIHQISKRRNAEISPVIRWGGDTYDAATEFEAGLRSKAEQFEATHAERKLNISVIEALWGESRKLSDEILKRSIPT
jgi:hypothetical protein